MDDYCLETVLKLQQTGSQRSNTNFYRSNEQGDDLSYLDREKLRIAEQRRKLEDKRMKAIKLLREKGLFSTRPSVLPNEDYHTQCVPTKSFAKPLDPLMQPNPAKPQNYDPSMFTSCTSHCPDNLLFNQPYVSDRVIRAKERAKWCEPPSESSREAMENNIFPQLAVQRAKYATDDAKLVRRYLSSSVYQTTFTDPFSRGPGAHNRIHAPPTLRNAPDPVQNFDRLLAYYPPSASWQSEHFDANVFDAALSRYPYMSEPRPYEFCSHAPRVEQIPSYSGCHGTKDIRVEDDNPYKQYKALNKVRREVPSHAFPYQRWHMPGYTGCSVELPRSGKNAVDSCETITTRNTLKITG